MWGQVAIRSFLGCALAAGLAAPGAAARSSPKPPISISIRPDPTGRPIPSGFLGFGLEYRSIPAYAGPDPAAVNPLLVQLIRNLDRGQRPIVRIGGESTDRSWWPVKGMARSPGITYDLGRSWTATARALLQAIGARAILGINLEADSTRIAGTEARALLSALGRGRVAGVEIGNEPELYSVIPWYNIARGEPVPWYRRHVGKPVLARRSGYDFADFAAEFGRFRLALPRVPLAGPATGNFSWLAQLPRFMSQTPALRWVTFHRYGLNGCVEDPAAPTYATLPHLLTLQASRGLMRGVSTYIALAHRHHSGFLIDEMNSVTCGGRVGVSNTFVSALWAVDALFAMVSQGVDAIDIHTFPDTSNGLFDFTRPGGRWVGVVHPEYYGLLLFAQAAPPHARLLAVGGALPADVRAWATLAPDGRERIVVINDSLRRTHAFAVRGAPLRGIPASAPATIERLTAPRASATTGVTIGGQSFGASTSTGLLAGIPRVQVVRPAGGRYQVSLAPASAALLTIAPRG